MIALFFMRNCIYFFIIDVIFIVSKLKIRTKVQSTFGTMEQSILIEHYSKNSEHMAPYVYSCWTLSVKNIKHWGFNSKWIIHNHMKTYRLRNCLALNSINALNLTNRVNLFWTDWFEFYLCYLFNKGQKPQECNLSQGFIVTKTLM